MKVVDFVDTSDNHKDELCVFDPEKYTDKEKLASAINKQIESAGFLDSYEDPEGAWEIGRSLAYNGYAQYQEYEFGVEDVELI